jgi:hypothetical protein
MGDLRGYGPLLGKADPIRCGAFGANRSDQRSDRHPSTIEESGGHWVRQRRPVILHGQICLASMVRRPPFITKRFRYRHEMNFPGRYPPLPNGGQTMPTQSAGCNRANQTGAVICAIGCCIPSVSCPRRKGDLQTCGVEDRFQQRVNVLSSNQWLRCYPRES